MDGYSRCSFFDELGNGDPSVQSFQDIIDGLLPDLLQTRLNLQRGVTELSHTVRNNLILIKILQIKIKQGKSLRPPTRAEVSFLISSFANPSEYRSITKEIVERKLKLDRVRIDSRHKVAERIYQEL